MSKQRSAQEVVEIGVGFAAEGSAGVAYAAIHGGPTLHPIRVPFAVRRIAGLDGRDVAYAALRAVARTIRERIDGPVRFALSDASLVADVAERRMLPVALTMPYVALRCQLNRFPSADVRFSASPEIVDLAARATAEASLHVAA